MADAKHYLVKLLLHDELTGMYASRRLRPGMELELQMERDPAKFEISVFFEGRYLGRIDPVLPEFITWFQDFEDNRCSVASLPVTYRDHMLRVILVRVEKGQRPHGTFIKAKPLFFRTEPEPEPEDVEPAKKAPQPAVNLPVLLPEDPAELEPPPPRFRPAFLAAYVTLVLAAGAGAAWLVSPHVDVSNCGKLKKTVSGITECRPHGKDEIWLSLAGEDASALCADNARLAIDPGTLMRIRLDGTPTPRFLVCRSPSKQAAAQ